MKRFLFLFITILLCMTIVSCGSNPQNESVNIEYLTIELDAYNYSDYIEFVPTNAILDNNGKIVELPYVSIKSKLYDDNWVLFSSSNTQFDVVWSYNNVNYGYSTDTNIFGTMIKLNLEDITTATDMNIVNIKGSYKFVHKDYIKEYIYEPNIRRVVLIDDNFSESFHPDDLTDFSLPY